MPKSWTFVKTIIQENTIETANLFKFFFKKRYFDIKKKNNKLKNVQTNPPLIPELI